VSLTADGQQLFSQCQRILDEVELLRSARGWRAR
jgi:DNA-binding transcriptional LysR family regulator